MHSQAATLSDQDRADIAAYLQSEVVQPGKQVVGTPPPATQTCVRLPRHRRREDHRARLPDPRRPVPRLHRAGAAATTRAASARTRSWPASSAAWTRRISRRSPSSSRSQPGLCSTDELREHGKCALKASDRSADSAMQPFRAFRIHQEGGKVAPRLETIGLDDLDAGEVVVKVSYSTINYKDALAATGAGKILRKYPLVGGIDLAGEVVSSQHAGVQARAESARERLRPVGDARRRLRRVRARAGRLAWYRFRPASTSSSAMAIGTAGYTAALAIHRMEQNGQQPRGRRDRRDGRDRRRRQPRHRHARGPRLQGRGGHRQEILGSGLSRADRREPACCCARRSISARGRWKKRSGPARSTTRRRRARVADAHHEILGQHRQHRPRRAAPS